MYKLSCPNTVERKLEHAQQLVGQLTSKSADLNWKVNDAEKDVGDLKCGFGTLKDDVTVLEISTDGCSNRHSDGT